MRTQVRKSEAGNFRLTTAIVSRSQTIARRVSQVMHKVRASHLDDAFLATEKGMCYRCEEEMLKERN